MRVRRGGRPGLFKDGFWSWTVPVARRGLVAPPYEVTPPPRLRGPPSRVSACHGTAGPPAPPPLPMSACSPQCASLIPRPTGQPSLVPAPSPPHAHLDHQHAITPCNTAAVAAPIPTAATPWPVSYAAPSVSRPAPPLVSRAVAPPRRRAAGPGRTCSQKRSWSATVGGTPRPDSVHCAPAAQTAAAHPPLRQPPHTSTPRVLRISDTPQTGQYSSPPPPRRTARRVSVSRIGGHRARPVDAGLLYGSLCLCSRAGGPQAGRGPVWRGAMARAAATRQAAAAARTRMRH